MTVCGYGLKLNPHYVFPPLQDGFDKAPLVECNAYQYRKMGLSNSDPITCALPTRHIVGIVYRVIVCTGFRLAARITPQAI